MIEHDILKPSKVATPSKRQQLVIQLL